MQRQEYGTPISLAEAKKATAAAEAEAIANNWAVVIAIVESSGHLVVLHRMDDASSAVSPSHSRRREQQSVSNDHRKYSRMPWQPAM